MIVAREVHYEITDRCNSNCPQCVRTDPSASKPWGYISNKECSLEQFKTFSPPEFLRSLDFIYFCGNYGDPILATDLLPILEYCYESHPKISIKVHSNCGVRSTNWWKELAQLTKSKKFCLVASVDGASQETQSVYRIGTQFDKIMSNLKAYIDEGGKAEWRFITFSHNEHEVDVARAMAEKMGFIKFHSYASNRFFGYDEFVYFEKGVEKRLKPSISQDKKFHDKKEVEISKLVKTPLDQVKIVCDAVKKQSLFIDYEGNILPCCHFGIRLYTLKRGVPDVNRDLYVYAALREFGVEKFNVFEVGHSQALENCNEFLKFLRKYWTESQPFVCRMICGKNGLSATH